MTITDTQKIPQFPLLVESGDIEWVVAKNGQLIKAMPPAKLAKPLLAELVINSTDGNNFTAKRYTLEGQIASMEGDGLADRLDRAIKSPNWLWYFQSNPVNGVTVHALLWVRIKCDQCNKVMSPHQGQEWYVTAEDIRFQRVCQECSLKAWRGTSEKGAVSVAF